MSNHTIIADFSNALVELLRNQLQDVLPNANAITLCSPADQGDALLGVYLYDITTTKDFFGNMIPLDSSHRQFPSTFFALHYMLTAYSSGESRYRGIEEQRILGKAMQVLHDNQNIDTSSFLDKQNPAVPNIHIDPLLLDFESKARIWSALQLPWKTSLFYKAEPLEMESAKRQKIQRVTSINFGEKGPQV